MKYIESWNAHRRKNAKLYMDLLENNPHITLPRTTNHALPVWHLFVIRVKDRDNFMRYLENNGIQSAIHYPTPLHLTKAYVHLGYKLGDFRISEQVQSEIVSLPMYAELTENEIMYVCEKINAYTFGDPVNSTGSLRII
jgi:dTDP-4-amino-4,6-dideoxygalactose transaminase